MFKINKQYFILLFLFFTALVSSAQNNDSLNKKEHKFMLGITIAPNYTWRKYIDEGATNSLGYNNSKTERPDFGYTVRLLETIQLTKGKIILEQGFTNANYKSKEKIERIAYTYYLKYQFSHNMFDFYLGYSSEIGKRKQWFIVPSFTISYIQNITQYIRIDNPPFSYNNQLFDLTKDKYAAFGGIRVGKVVVNNKKIVFLTSIGATYSSMILSKRGADKKNLIIFNVNFSIIPKFR